MERLTGSLFCLSAEEKLNAALLQTGQKRLCNFFWNDLRTLTNSQIYLFQNSLSSPRVSFVSFMSEMITYSLVFWKSDELF